MPKKIASKAKSRYTISSFSFKTLEEAKKQILKFEENGGFNPKSKIFEIVNEFDVEIKKVVATKKVK